MKNYVLTPGPVPVPEFVMLEMAKPIIHHRTEEFEEIFYKATQGLKKVFMTEEEVLILASGPKSKDYKNLLLSYGCMNVINKYTRIAKNMHGQTTKTIIDHIITNDFW